MTFADLLEKSQVYTADFETAIHLAGYGKFQALLLAVSGLIYATCAISTTTLSFVLPSAECDFNLTSLDKGKLSATPLIGMIVGCCMWGSIAESRGRKCALILSLLVDFLAAFISAFVSSFNYFLVCRFFNGLGIIGATSIIFSYLGEFFSIKDRDRILGRLEIFWNVGVIVLPGLAWGILSNPSVEIVEKSEDFSPWKAFVMVCGFPSLICAIFLFFMPESPKYLMSKGYFVQAKSVFQTAFAMNTGKSLKEYPVLLLEGELEDNNNTITLDEEELDWGKGVAYKVKKFFVSIKQLIHKPYIKYLAIASFADFGLMASYYTLMMWFPEIFERFNQFETANPGIYASVCTVSGKCAEEAAESTRKGTINTRVFLDTFIIGLSCLPTSLSLSYFMKKLGKKFVLICGLVLSGFCTVALNWVSSSTETLILSCVFEALTSILEAVIFCVVVDLFPTNLRAVALSLTATSGRLGAIFGNVMFGLLIDISCYIPIYLFGFLLIVSGMLCIAVPQSDDYHVLH